MKKIENVRQRNKKKINIVASLSLSLSLFRIDNWYRCFFRKWILRSRRVNNLFLACRLAEKIMKNILSSSFYDIYDRYKNTLHRITE